MKRKTTKTPLQSIIGKTPWNIWKGYGSFLFFNFGGKRRIDCNTLEGQYVLEVSMAHWIISQRTRKVADSESSDIKIKQSAKIFERKRLLEIVLRQHLRTNKPLYSARFSFENHWHLDVFMYETGTYDDMFAVYSKSQITTYDYEGNLITKQRSNHSTHTTA